MAVPKKKPKKKAEEATQTPAEFLEERLESESVAEFEAGIENAQIEVIASEEGSEKIRELIYVPLKDREQLPEIAYVDKNYPKPIALDGVFTKFKAGQMVRDRLKMRKLLNAGIGLVETLEEVDFRS